MSAPLRTGGQFLEEHGFGVAPRPDSFPEYPDLNAQLEALRKLDRNAPEIPYVEYALGRARQARLDTDYARERTELATAKVAIEKSFRRRTPAGEWTKVAVFLGLLALAGILLWMERRKKLRRRRQNVPLADSPYNVAEGDEDDYVGELEPEDDEDDAAEDEDDE